VEPERWARVKALFGACLELPAADRALLLAQECAGDPDLLREVESLLDASARAAARDDTVPDAVVAARQELARELELEGQVVGAYRILERIGEGGMGVVFRAERADGQFTRQVAVKVVRPESATPGLLRRFADERQTLAALEHPHIARLLDAGTTADGLPYLVMEHVAGEELDVHCARHGLGARDRVRLFLQVCDAVEHAHRNLVVHRDLKPANILVAAEGQVKLLDFGIARLMPSAPEDDTLRLTRPADRVLTPAYASPEQILGRTVTTSSDVYSLGVILVELASGQHPYGEAALSPDDAMRAACGSQAPGAGRTPEPPRTRPALRLSPDLRAISERAMARRPEDRYPSVSALAEDLRRSLDGRPVSARSGLAYRASRLVRRHWLAAVAAFTVLAALAAAAVVSTLQARVAARERDRARVEEAKALEVTAFLQGMLESADPSVGSRDVSVAEVLDRAAAEMNRLDAHPEVEAAIRTTIARSYRGLGHYRDALPHFERALELTREFHGADAPETGCALALLAGGLHEVGELEAADERFCQALALLDRPGGNPSATLAGVLNDHAVLLRHLGRLDQAEREQRRALGLFRGLPGQRPEQVAMGLNNLGVIMEARSRPNDAEPLYREALELTRRAHDRPHPDLAFSLTSLAGVLIDTGRPTEAEPLYREALAVREQALGPDHPLTGRSLAELADALRAAGRPQEAEAPARRGLAVAQSALPPDHPDVARALLVLGQVLLDAGDPGAAEPLLRQALAIRRQALPEGHWLVASAECTLGRAVLAAGGPTEARPLLAAGLEVMSRAGKADTEIGRACAEALAEIR